MAGQTMTPLRLLRSWAKEEARTPRRWIALLTLVFSPVLALHLINRSGHLLSQQASARDDALALLETSLADVERNAWDWSHWNDTYRFATGTNPGYVRANLATAALFNNGAVMVMLRPDGSPLLSYSHPQLSRNRNASLVRCLRDNLPRLSDRRSRLRLACRDHDGVLFIGSATPITDNLLQSKPAGTMALLQPMPRRDDTPAMRRHLQALQQKLLWLPAATAAAGAQAIQPTIHASGGEVLGMERPSRARALQDTLEGDLPILLAIPLAAALLRGFSLLERRRQRLRERQLERQANRRLRTTCRELDQLIDELLPAARAQCTDEPTPEPQGGVERTTLRFRRFLQSARRLALFDSLTQLPNRHYFIEQLETVAIRHRRNGTCFAVLFIDIDKFKVINDSFGHAIGDAVLLEVCRRLGTLVHSQDFLARYGGDELAMILDLGQPHSPSREALSAAARERAEQMVEALRDAVPVQALSIPVSLSIGITLVDPHEQNLAGVIQRSDLAMYQAKRNRTNRIIGPDDVAQIPQLSSYQLFTDLLEAIQKQQLQVYFQPIRSGGGSQIGVEALARWLHPQRGWIEPQVFLEIAEQHRQMQILGDELIRLSLDGFQQLQQSDPNLTLFLNLTPSQLSDPGLVDNLAGALRSRNLSGNQIVLEITENTLLEPLPAVVRNLELLRATGISLALDDFGTGYSSLVMLKSLCPDIVKIDKTFIQAMRSDDRALHIISLIAELAPRLGMELVAEGIEDPDTLQQLMHLGIQRFQGHELGRPSPLVELLAQAPAQSASNRSIV